MTNRDLNKAERDQLEALIDSVNLTAVVMALSEICGEKAEHIESNWQDKALARVWNTASGAIGVSVAKIPLSLGR